MDSTPENSIINFEIITDKKYRTIQHNRYLWGIVYKAFVPDNFDTAEDAHQYFRMQFLRRMDVIDIKDDGFLNYINEIKGKASKILDFARDETKVKIAWIRSTTDLSPTELNDYINKITLVAGENNISIEQFDKQKDYEV